jgi:hypothetical protein
MLDMCISPVRARHVRAIWRHALVATQRVYLGTKATPQRLAGAVAFFHMELNKLRVMPGVRGEAALAVLECRPFDIVVGMDRQAMVRSKLARFVCQDCGRLTQPLALGFPEGPLHFADRGTLTSDLPKGWTHSPWFREEGVPSRAFQCPDCALALHLLPRTSEPSQTPAPSPPQ